MAALVPTTDRQVVFLHDLDDGSFTQDGDLVSTKQTTAVANADGSVTVTNPDGTTVSTPAAGAADTNTIQTGATYDDLAGELTQTFTDKDGNALPSIVTNLSALKDNVDTDTITTGLTIDPATRVVTITRTDIDGTALADLTATLPAATVNTDTIQTGATFDPATGVLTQTFTDVDGTALPSVTTDLSALKDNDDVTANTLTWDAATASFVATITEGGNTLTATLAVPDGVAECGDKSLTIDNATGELQANTVRPQPRHRIASADMQYGLTTGAAITALVDTDVAVDSTEILPFDPQLGCYSDLLTVDHFLGNCVMEIATPGDTWQLINSVVLDNAALLFNGETLVFQNTNTAGIAKHSFGAPQGSTTAACSTALTNRATFTTRFEPEVYTEHANNVLGVGVHRIRMHRRQVLRN